MPRTCLILSHETNPSQQEKDSKLLLKNPLQAPGKVTIQNSFDWQKPFLPNAAHRPEKDQPSPDSGTHTS